MHFLPTFWRVGTGPLKPCKLAGEVEILPEPLDANNGVRALVVSAPSLRLDQDDVLEGLEE